ncbi:MAG: hypothetical protein IID36_03160 [Planctomycetes bacterium]|nr:hypothetical protein [Planctomycetota bacterium]
MNGYKTSKLTVTVPKFIDAGTGNLVIAGIGIGNCSAPCLTKSGCCSDCTGAKCCASKKDKCCAKCNVPVAITVVGGLGCCKDAKCAACRAKAKCTLCKSGKNCTKCVGATAPCISLGGGVQVIRALPSYSSTMEFAALPTIDDDVWFTALEPIAALAPTIKSGAWVTAPETISTFEQYMAGKDGAGKIAYMGAPAVLATWPFDGDDDDDDDADDRFERRLRRLEKQMERLGEHLEKIADRLEDGGRGRRGMREPREPRAPRAPREPRTPRDPRPPASWRGPAPKPDVFGLLGSGGSGWFAPESDETVIRSYRLPGNKLELLTALMVLSDVPVLVSPHDDHIDVHGNARQHEIFEAFVDMIHPSPKKKLKAAKKDKEKKKAKSKGRGPVRRGRSDARNALYNQYLAGALHLAGAADAQARAEQQYVGELQRYVTEIAESQNRAVLRQYTRAVKQLRSVNRGQLIETVKTHAQSLQQRAAELAREAERLLEQAESLETDADNLSVEAEILRSEASDIEDKEARTQTRRHANLIEKEVRAMATEARRSNGEANKLENRAERLADAAEVLYDTISEILDRITEDGGR